MSDQVDKQAVINRLNEALGLKDPEKIIGDIKQFKEELARRWVKLDLN